jgi:hypothetical protein
LTSPTLFPALPTPFLPFFFAHIFGRLAALLFLTPRSLFAPIRRATGKNRFDVRNRL